MMMVLVAVAAQETARRRRKQQKQQYFQQGSPTSKSSDDLEIAKPTPPPPGPTPIPFFGNLLNLRKYSECPYQGFSALKEKFGPVYSLKLGTSPAVVVNTYDTIKEVLITKANSFDARPDLLRFRLYFGGDRQHCKCSLGNKLLLSFFSDQILFLLKCSLENHIFIFLSLASLPETG